MYCVFVLRFHLNLTVNVSLLIFNKYTCFIIIIIVIITCNWTVVISIWGETIVIFKIYFFPHTIEQLYLPLYFDPDHSTLKFSPVSVSHASNTIWWQISTARGSRWRLFCARRVMFGHVFGSSGTRLRKCNETSFQDGLSRFKRFTSAATE